MSNDDHWIAARIGDAREQSPLITHAVSTLVGELLKGQLSQRQLPRGELSTVAIRLLADMIPVPRNTEAKP